MKLINIKTETIFYRIPRDPCNCQLDEQEWPTLPMPGKHTAPTLPRENADPAIIIKAESRVDYIPRNPCRHQRYEQEWPPLPTTGRRTAPAAPQGWPVLPMVEYRIAPAVPLNEIPVGLDSRLLRLPAEIRNVIYAMVLPSCPADFEASKASPRDSSDGKSAFPDAYSSCSWFSDGAEIEYETFYTYPKGPGTVIFHGGKLQMKGLRLTRVNKQLRSEVLPMLWSVYHTLVIKIYDDKAEVARCFFEGMGNANSTLLERVVFVLEGNAIDVKRQEYGAYGMVVTRNGWAKERHIEGAIVRVGRYLELYREKTSFGWREWADLGHISYAVSWKESHGKVLEGVESFTEGGGPRSPVR